MAYNKYNISAIKILYSTQKYKQDHDKETPDTMANNKTMAILIIVKMLR